MLLRKRGESNTPSNLDGWHWKYWMQCVTEIIFLNWNCLMNTKNKEIKLCTWSETPKNNFFADILANSKNSKDTWRAINLLTNKHAPVNTSTTSGISPDDLNNHFCSVASKVIKTDNSPINELTVLEQYCTEKITHEANALPFMTVREVYKSVCHLKQSNTKGTDGLDGKSTASLGTFYC